MKKLTLLRHAKSGWDDTVQRDFDRPLNAKGHKAALLMGKYMQDAGLRFDHIVASPAVRVVETLGEVARGYGKSPAAQWEKRIYLASAVTLLDIVTTFPQTAESALLAGHNPGLEDLLLLLVPDSADDVLRASAEEKFPTAALAELLFDVEDWADIKPGAATLARFIRPRDLDATLGPDSD
ncbi:MAG: histidine phosphatase family protein [Sphingomonas sp.]|jgi:phosphohistidine phosphatase